MQHRLIAYTSAVSDAVEYKTGSDTNGAAARFIWPVALAARYDSPVFCGSAGSVVAQGDSVTASVPVRGACGWRR